MNEPWRINLPLAVILKAIAPKLDVPKGGWDAQEFAAQGRILILAIDRLAKITQRKAIPVVARKAMELFRHQLEQVIRRVHGRLGIRSAKAEAVTISLPQHESMWMRALEEVFAEQDVEIVTELVPPVQSVMAQAYNRVSVLLGHEADAVVNQRIARQARELASQIVQINDTTRRIFQREIIQSIKDGLSVSQTAERLRELLPKFERGRISTIARTETNSAWTQGSVAAFQQSDTLTHVSVIGCESRERERWNSPSYQQFMWRGESTCNIQDVPILDADKLRFHPNHTGTLVPSRFRNADGTVD
jgi:hypothetical protein